MKLVRERAPIVPFKRACEALDVPLASAKRYVREPKGTTKTTATSRPPSPRRLDDEQRKVIVDTMHSARFIDQTPRRACQILCVT